MAYEKDPNKKPTRARAYIHWYTTNEGDKQIKKMFEIYRLDNSLQFAVKSTDDTGKWNIKADIVITLAYGKASSFIELLEDLVGNMKTIGAVNVDKYSAALRIIGKKGTNVIQYKLSTEKDNPENKAFYLNLINDEQKVKVTFSGMEFIEVDGKITGADGKEIITKRKSDLLLMQLEDMLKKVKNFIYDADFNDAFEKKMLTGSTGGYGKKLPGEDDEDEVDPYATRE